MQVHSASQGFIQNMQSQNQKRQRIQKQAAKTKDQMILSSSDYKRSSISPLGDQFLASKALNKRSKIEEQSLTKPYKSKKSVKASATDQSTNHHPSAFQESIRVVDRKQLNEEYFQRQFQPLVFKPKKGKFAPKKVDESRMLEDISIKVTEMGKMVHSQEKEIRDMKSSVSEKELHRLMKIHSIEKLKLLNEISRATSIISKKAN